MNHEFYRSQYNFRQDKPGATPAPTSEKLEITQENSGFLVNPYKRPASKKKSRTKIYLILLAVIILGWVGILIYLPYFKITKITYLGLNFIKKEDIDSTIKNDLLNNRLVMTPNGYFLINTKSLEKKLSEKYSLNSIKVKKIFPSELLVDLDEKISTIIYDNGLGYYLLDNEGGVLKFLDKAENPEVNISKEGGMIVPPSNEKNATEATVMATSSLSTTSTPAISSLIQGITLPNEEKELIKTHIPEFRKIKKNFGSYVILYDTRNISVTEKQPNIISKKIIENTIVWSDILEKEGMSVKYMTCEHPLGGITTHTDLPWVIIFDPTKDLTEQLTRMKEVLKDNIINEYIDLRFSDRVYWK